MGNQKETQKNPQYKYASTREKLCFGIGAIGKDAICNLVGAFLMLYFTDTLYLAPAFVGVLFFVARIWDAVNDPMMGMIVDNTHTRFGKFRIWLVIGTLVNSVVFVLLFHSFSLSGTASGMSDSCRLIHFHCKPELLPVSESFLPVLISNRTLPD
jgi:melibiose permease